MNEPTVFDARFVSFGTWRKNGDVVDTPIWAAPDGNCFYMFSAGNAGKVKRVRNSDKARLAPCTATGKVLGPYQPARARLLTDPEDIDAAYKALYRKYGWQMRSIDFFAKLAGKFNKRQLIAIELSES